MSRILQITDCHVVTKGALANGVVDTGAALQETVRAINDWLAHIGPVDRIIVTGDLTDHGRADEYARFSDIMADCPVPMRVLPGNHDLTEPFRAAFPGLGGGGPVNWLDQLADFAVLGLDSHTDQIHSGRLSDDTLEFLSQALTEVADQPLIVALHHPPFQTGILPMDQSNLLNGDALLARLAKRTAPTRIICGHVHRTVMSDHGGLTQIICPGTSHAVRLDYRPDHLHSLTREPAGMMLHDWRNGHFVSHLLSIPCPDESWPFIA